jgi:hypothetical protein
MADLLGGFLDLNAIYNLATSSTYDYWIMLGVNLIISTIVGGIVLLIILEIFSKKFGERVSPTNAFIVVLLVNIINLIGLMGILLPFVAAIPFGSVILPLLVWIVFIKVFFGDLSLLHVLIIAVVFFALTIMVVPVLANMVTPLIPSFG